jgi:two-component system response regulator NreC
MNTIRLMLVDDHDIVRTGLKSFLDTQEGLQVVAEARSGGEAIKRAQELHPDVVYLFEMLSAGASGYLTKQVAAEELVIAIRCVALGNVYLQPALARWLLEDYRRLLTQTPPGARRFGEVKEGEKGLDVLSKRELQVLEAVAEGNTNNEIGEQLGISPKTVARHRERIMHKLNLHSSTELVKFAIRTGLIDLK